MPPGHRGRARWGTDRAAHAPSSPRTGGAVLSLLHDRATPRTLGLLRAAVFTIWLGDLLREPFHELAGLPLELFQPLGVLQLVPASAWPVVFTGPLLLALKAILVTLLIPLIAGVGPYRVLAVAAVVLLIFWQGLHRGMLGVAHRELALLYITCVLALFPAADGFSLRRTPHPPRLAGVYPPAMMAAVLVFTLTYVAVGIRRLTSGGFDIFTDGTILRYLVVRSAEPGFWTGGAGLWVLTHPWIGWLVQLAFPVVTVMEIGSPLVLISRRFRLAWLAVILTFHLASWATMQIFFLQNVLLMPVLLLELESRRA